MKSIASIKWFQANSSKERYLSNDHDSQLASMNTLPSQKNDASQTFWVMF